MLIYDVVELLILGVKHLLLIVVVFVVLLLVVNIVLSFVGVDALGPVLVLAAFDVVILAIQLFENVLDLAPELLVTLLHQVLQHLWHSELLGFLPELLPSEYGVQRAVDVGAHL